MFEKILPRREKAPSATKHSAFSHILRAIIRRVMLTGCLLCQMQPGRGDNLQISPSEAREFSVKGIVNQIDSQNQRIVITHEAIPGFMDAMTMPFHVRTLTELAGLKENDSVAFRLFVDHEKSWIEKVEKIAPLTTAQTPTNMGTRPPALLIAAPRTNNHPLLHYSFTNELGQPVRLADFRGQVLALTFFFSRCPLPDYCPRLSRNFEEASRKLQDLRGAPTNYHFLSVTFDPEFDTPARLKAYAKGFSYDPTHWSFITGGTNEIKELARLSDFKFERNGAFFNHDLRTLIIDANGKLRTMFPLGGDLSEPIVAEILKAAGVTNFGNRFPQANAQKGS